MIHHDHDDHDHDQHDHDHKHAHAPPHKDHDTGPVGAYELLEEAVRSLLIEKGVLTAQEIAAQVDLMDSRSPALGAKVVAKAWVDADFKKRLLADTRSALAEVGIDIGTLADYRTVENVPGTHNVVVCTLCSCYPKLLLGIPPARGWWSTRAVCSRSSASSCRRAPKCASMIPRPTCATWCCPCGRRPRAAGARPTSPPS